MSRPLNTQVLLRTGIVLALYPFDTAQGIEIQRAPDDSGDPDLGNLIIIGLVNPGVEIYTDILPIDGDNRHYRIRHRVGNATSDWTDWIAHIPTTIPDPLPAIPSLVPKIDVLQTVSATSVSFVATAQLGELEHGHVEFQDPTRSFTGTGSINNGDKTLTVSDGDFTDEDVNLYVSVADAGAGGSLLETRIDSVTSATEVEVETAAGAAVNNKNVIVGGGWFSDFDFDASDESQETNTRNRPEVDSDASWIMFRAVAPGDVSSPLLINIPIQIQPALLEVDNTTHDDGVDNIYSTSWTPNATVTDAMSITFNCFENEVLAKTDTEGSPLTNTSKNITDGGSGDGGSDSHYVQFILKSSGGETLGTWETVRSPSTT